MELLFFWIDKIKSKTNVSWNLNPAFCFKYNDTKKEIELVEKKEKINIFSMYYPSVLNINAVVGENGTGKTSLLKALCRCFVEGNTQGGGDSRYIFVFQKNTKFYITSSIALEKIKMKDFQFNKQPIQDVCLFLYSNALSLPDYVYNREKNISDYFVNLTLAARIRSNYIERRENRIAELNQNELIMFYHDETEKQILFYSSGLLNKMPFSVPKLHVKVLTFESCLRSYLQDICASADHIKSEIGNEIADVVRTILEKYDSHTVDGNIIACVMFSLVGRLLPRLISEFTDDWYVKTGNLLDEWKNVTVNSNSFVDQTIKYVRCVAEKNSLDNNVVKAYQCVIETLKNSNIIEYNTWNNDFVFKVNQDKSTLKILKEFYRNYRLSMGEMYDYLLFEWGMSTGEFAFFSFFSNLYAVNNIPKEKDSILLLIDEADLYLHPSWQQKYIHWIIEHLPHIFEDRSIQIILATHSPIFLSDIPNANILYRTKEDGEGKLTTAQLDGIREHKTFSDNIYNLYQNSFFLNQNNEIGVTGEFSKIIISKLRCEMMKHLKNKNDEVKNGKMKQWKQIIDMIGEPIIRHVLLDVWYKIAREHGAGVDFIMEEYRCLSKKEKEDFIRKIIEVETIS